jgi:hypothetical protein
MHASFRALAAITILGGVAPADLPLTVSHIVTGPDSRVTLTNTAAQPVTAWSLATITRASNGRTHREVWTADGYLSEVTHGLNGASERLERLMPRQSREITVDPLPDGATVEVAAVVMDDGTAMGDERELQLIFDHRVKERDALRAVVEAFDDVRRAQHGTAALDALHDKLSAIAQRAESLPCRAALDAVDTYRARGGEPEAIDQSLGTYAAFVTREYELAARHAQRKM